jgi:pimeloyl-ACP methyl ester carboxylesterase
MAKKVLTGLGALVLVAVTAAYTYWPADARAYRSAWRQTVDSRFVDTPQARLHYVRDGAGSPVILLAPSSGWPVLWQWQLEVLGRSHTVYAVDLPGNTGYTRLKGSFRYDLDGITGVLGDFARALRLGRLTLVGNSWDGGFAPAYAQRHPERVSRLVLISASGLDLPDPSSWELMKWPVAGELAAKLSTSRSTLRSYAAKSFTDPWVLTDGLLEEIHAPMTLRENVRAVYFRAVY